MLSLPLYVFVAIIRSDNLFLTILERLLLCQTIIDLLDTFLGGGDALELLEVAVESATGGEARLGNHIVDL